MSWRDLVERVTAAGEDRRRAARGQADRDLLAGGIDQLAIEQRDDAALVCAAGGRRAPAPAAARPAQRRRRRGRWRGAAAPADGRGAAIVATPIAPARFSASQRSSAVFTCDLHVVGDLHRRKRVHVHRDLAAEIQAGEIVPAGFGNRQAVADEHHRRFHRSVELAARAERRVLADDERLLPCRRARARAATAPARAAGCRVSPAAGIRSCRPASAQSPGTGSRRTRRPCRNPACRRCGPRVCRRPETGRAPTSSCLRTPGPGIAQRRQRPRPEDKPAGTWISWRRDSTKRASSVQASHPEDEIRCSGCPQKVPALPIGLGNGRIYAQNYPKLCWIDS